MPIEPHHVRYRVGTIVAMPKQPPKPPAMPYAQAVKLEARRAAERDKPQFTRTNSGMPATAETVATWRNDITLAFPAPFIGKDAAEVWGVTKSAAHNRLIKLEALGHLMRLPKQRGDKAGKWRVVG